MSKTFYKTKTKKKTSKICEPEIAYSTRKVKKLPLNQIICGDALQVLKTFPSIGKLIGRN